MWQHIDDEVYQKAHVGVAISDHPTGPFTFRESFRPPGFESRNMTLFKDDDQIEIQWISERDLSYFNGNGK